MGAHDNDASNDGRSGLSRRAFLGLGGAGTATTYVALSVGPGGKALAQIIKPPPPDKPKKTYTTVMRRAADQLVLTLDFWNLIPDFTQTPVALRQVDPNATANYLSVGFPGQNIAEEVFFRAGSPTVAQTGGPQHLGHPAPPHRAAHRPTAGRHQPARVRHPQRGRPALEPRPAAVQPHHGARVVHLRPERRAERAAGHPTVGDGARHRQAGEAERHPDRHRDCRSGSCSRPTRPTPQKEGFVNAVQPVQHEGRTELWHTRLSVLKPTVIAYFPDETDRKNRTVRAVWATDPGFKKDLKHNAPSSTDDLYVQGTARVPGPLRHRPPLVGLLADVPRAALPRPTVRAHTRDGRPADAELARRLARVGRPLGSAQGPEGLQLVAAAMAAPGGAGSGQLRPGRPQGLPLPLRAPRVGGHDQRARVLPHRRQQPARTSAPTCANASSSS